MLFEIKQMLTEIICIYTVLLESLWTPCRICENVRNFNNIREIIQNACYFLIYYCPELDILYKRLLHLVHKTNKKTSANIKIPPFKSLWTLGSK